MIKKRATFPNREKHPCPPTVLRNSATSRMEKNIRQVVKKTYIG